MSILIRGVRYPRSSPLTLIIYPDGTVSSVYDNQRGTAVHVLPHGRLIDVSDAVAALLRDNYYAAALTIGNCPTIISAELPKEES